MSGHQNKRILVYNVAAEDGGSLTILNDFYKSAVAYSHVNTNISFIFVISLPKLDSTDNVTVLRFPFIKKSWGHRILFDKFGVKKLLKNISPDAVISLQNTTLGCYKGKQFVYMHQSLQYCPKKFSFIKKEERATAIRQHIICKSYKSGLKKAEHIYVQTNWIKEATANWIQKDHDIITVVPVSVHNIPDDHPEYVGTTCKVFFYPARAEMYKNHRVIIDACRILENRGLNDYKIIFTIDKKDNPYAKAIYDESTELNIEWVGTLPQEDVLSLYSSSILLFPSYLETCGLPLLEARRMKSVIITADMPYAQEAVGDYPNAYFFNFDDATKLADEMEEWIIGHGKYCTVDDATSMIKSSTLLETMMRDIIGEQKNE